MESNATEPLYFELCIGLDNLAKCSSAMTIVPKTSPAAIWAVWLLAAGHHQ